MVTIIKKGSSRAKILLALKRRSKKPKGPDLLKYCGSIKLLTDPLEIQKELRNEWE